MQQYSYQVPSHPKGGIAFMFDVIAEDPFDSLVKARALLEEQSDDEGNLHIDLTFGLTAGKLKIFAGAIDNDSLIDVKEIPDLM
jgi:hypothetical protein